MRSLAVVLFAALVAAVAANEQLPPFSYNQLMADLPSSDGFHPFGFQPDASDSVVQPPGAMESAFPFSPPPLPPDMSPQQRAAATGGVMLQAQQPQPYMTSAFAEVAANAVRQQNQMQAQLQMRQQMMQQQQQQQRGPWYSTPSQAPPMQQFFQSPVNSFGPQAQMPRFQSYRGSNYANGAYVLNNRAPAVFHAPTHPAFAVGPSGPTLRENMDAINVSPRFIESMAEALPEASSALPAVHEHTAAPTPIEPREQEEEEEESGPSEKEMEENDHVVPPSIEDVDAKLPRFARVTRKSHAAASTATTTTTAAKHRVKITKPIQNPTDEEVVSADAEEGVSDKSVDDEDQAANPSANPTEEAAGVPHQHEPAFDGTGAALNDGDDESLDSGKPLHNNAPAPAPTPKQSATNGEHASALKPIVDADSHKFAQTQVSGSTAALAQSAAAAAATPTPIVGTNDAAITPADVKAVVDAALPAPAPANDGKLYKCVGSAESCKVAVNPNDIQWTVKTVPAGSLGPEPTANVANQAATATQALTQGPISTNPAIAALQQAYYAKRSEIEKDKLWIVQVKQIISNYQTKMRAVQQSISAGTRQLGQDRQKIINMLKQEKAAKINAELQIALQSLQKLESASQNLNSKIGALGKSRSELRATIARLRGAMGKAGNSDFATSTKAPLTTASSFSFREILPSNNDEVHMQEMQAANDQGHKFMHDIISMLEQKAQAVNENEDSMIPPPVSDLPAEPVTHVLEDRLAVPVTPSHDFEPASEELAFQRKLQSIIARERTL